MSLYLGGRGAALCGEGLTIQITPPTYGPVQHHGAMPRGKTADSNHKHEAVIWLNTNPSGVTRVFT